MAIPVLRGAARSSGPIDQYPSVSPLYAALRSACVALAKGGIEWRGTFYPLRLL